ncbi:MAG: VOC family protein [Anaerolineae bacterium]
MTSINLVVLRTSRLEIMLKFYGILGLEFTEERHGSGPIHYSAQVDGVVLEIYSGGEGNAPDRKLGGATMIGFGVNSLDTLLSNLNDLGVVPLAPPKDSQWGRRVVILDPDGRAVEVSELLP